jgi:nitrous oxidase accessory protein NosD
MICLAVSGAAMGNSWTVDAGGGGDFTTIQAAITAAGVGDTINVLAGTYNERLSISKSLTLLGPQWNTNPVPAGIRTNSAFEAIITEAALSTPNPDVLIEVPSGVTGVTVSGFSMYGDLTNTTADTSTIRCWDDNLTISNNIISGLYGVLYKGNDGATISQNRITTNKIGVTVQPNAATNVTMSGNSFALGTSPIGGESAMYATGVNGLTVSDNVASGFVNGNGFGGSNLTNAVFSGNTFTDGKDGVNIFGNTTYVTIEGNTLAGMSRYGINIKGQHIDINNNEITGNATGVYIAEHTLETLDVKVNANNIYDNTTYGLQVVPTGTIATVDAQGNWWGDATGPLDNKTLPNQPNYNNPTGLGDPVSAYADYANWLAEPVPEPATMGLLALGGLGALIRRRRTAK